MKQPSNIPLLQRTNGKVLPGDVFSSVVLSSARTNWRQFVVEEHHHRSRELADLMYIQHVVAVNVGRPINCEFKKDGRFQRIYWAKNAITLFPSQQPFFRRSIDENGSADVLYVALDPVFVSQIAETLEIYPNRVERLNSNVRPTRASGTLR